MARIRSPASGTTPSTTTSCSGCTLLLRCHRSISSNARCGRSRSAERDRYHQENLIAAELMLIPREQVPATYADLENYVEEVTTSGRLRRTDVADNVADLIRRGPVPASVATDLGIHSLCRIRNAPSVAATPLRRQVVDLQASVVGGQSLDPRSGQAIPPAAGSDSSAPLDGPTSGSRESTTSRLRRRRRGAEITSKERLDPGPRVLGCFPADTRGPATGAQPLRRIA